MIILIWPLWYLYWRFRQKGGRWIVRDFLLNLSCYKWVNFKGQFGVDFFVLFIFNISITEFVLRRVRRNVLRNRDYINQWDIHLLFILSWKFINCICYLDNYITWILFHINLRKKSICIIMIVYCFIKWFLQIK